MRFPSLLLSMVLPLAVLALLIEINQASGAHVLSGIDLRSGKEEIILRDDTGVKATVLVFVSSKCPCSMSHIGELKSLAHDFPEFRFVGVNSNRDETIESARAYFESQNLGFPILRDEKSLLADEFKATKTPHAFIFDREGKRLFQGGVSNSSTFARADKKFLREALEDLKAGREVRTPLARALGCAIARGDRH